MMSPVNDESILLIALALFLVLLIMLYLFTRLAGRLLGIILGILIATPFIILFESEYLALILVAVFALLGFLAGNYISRTLFALSLFLVGVVVAYLFLPLMQPMVLLAVSLLIGISLSLLAYRIK